METNENIIQHIVDNKIPCFFISPHPDDAILSCGDLISYLATRTPVTIVTVFTQATTQRMTFSAHQFLKNVDYLDAQELFSQRRKEDRKVIKTTRAKVAHLDFVDALWRKKTNIGSVRTFLGSIVPEFTHIYPTYRLHVASGRIAKDDEPLLDKLNIALSTLIKKSPSDYFVFAPLAIGGHVDHCLVREVCAKTFTKVIFWQDFPYNTKSSGEQEFINSYCVSQFSWTNNPARKRLLIQGYESQVLAMFPSGEIPLVPEQYYIGRGFNKRILLQQL